MTARCHRNPARPGLDLAQPCAAPGGLPGRLLAELRRARADGGPVRIGSADAVRDFVDVRDVARAVVAAAQVPVLTSPVLNIGSGRGTSVAELVAAFAAVSGHRGEVRFDGADSVRSAAVPWQRSDVSAAAAVPGWRPRIDLRTSLAQLWHKSDSRNIAGSSRGR